MKDDFDEEYEELDFFQPHDKFDVTLVTSMDLKTSNIWLKIGDRVYHKKYGYGTL